MGWSVDELVVVERGGLVVAVGHVVVGDPEHGVVGERAGRVVVADVLEGLEGVALGVEQGLLAGEAGVQGSFSSGLALGSAWASQVWAMAYSRLTSLSRNSVPG